MIKTGNRDNLKATIVKMIAIKMGVKPRQVYRVLSGEQQNETIMEEYMTMREDAEETFRKHVEKLIPFPEKTEKKPKNAQKI